MKILRRLFLTIPLIIIILLIAAGVLVRCFADRAIKMGIEKGGSAVLPVAVKVGDADLRVLGGKLALNDLIIENPPGYKHKNLLELRSGSVEVNIRSLLGDIVEIKQIKLDGAVVVLEQKGLVHSNIRDILRALPKVKEAKQGPAQDGPPRDGPAQDSPAQDGPATEGKKLHIEELIISNTTVKVKLLPLPGKIDTVPLKLGTIRLTDLGGDNELNTAKLITTILSSIFSGIAEQGKGILPDDLVDGISGALGKTVGLGKEILDSAGDIGKGIGEGLKSINPFKKKKEE